ncbi:MAG TPA: MBL fold metallo-hydrolase [Candidatus Nanoarchaeia archaeon]|nr:MBL fold metallo-hydrolase [Candidatus Nanoarchaeia archaeon]
MKLIVHGAGQEVGRSCFQLQTKGGKFLLDGGLKLSQHGAEFPVCIGPEDIQALDAIFLSHAHLDHSGALPLFDAWGLRAPIFATKPTKALAEVLLLDAFQIGRLHHEHLGYEKFDVEKVLSFMQKIQWRNEGTLKGLNYQFYDAGHIPGSSTIQLEAEDKRLVYTGDIRNTDSRLMQAADTQYEMPVDVLITESTYGDREHPPRAKTEKEFLASVGRTLARGGSALVPVFGVGRAQELLLLLATQDFGIPVYVDGMAKGVTEMLFEFGKSIRSVAELQKAYKSARPIKGHIQRNSFLLQGKQGIFLTTSGMLTGGPAMDYLKVLGMSQRNSILLTGYQEEHTNGRMLLEEQQAYIDGWKAMIKADVQQFDFSAHAGQSDLRRLIRQTNPHRIIAVHGDPSAAQSIVDWAQAIGIPASAPKNGEFLTI